MSTSHQIAPPPSVDSVEGGFPYVEMFPEDQTQSAARWITSKELYEWPSQKKMLSFFDTRLSGLAADLDRTES